MFEWFKRVGKRLGIVLSAAFIAGVFPALSAGEDAHASTTGSLCPSSASFRQWAGSVATSLPTTGLTAETGTLVGCIGPVSRTNDGDADIPRTGTLAGTADYFVYFDAAAISDKDLFGEGSILEVTITGAPGAAGWYVKAFELDTGSGLSQTYGSLGTNGIFNYGVARSYSDLTSDLQPNRTGTAQIPEPTYSVAYGFTPTAIQRQSIVTNGIAVYLGYLGSTSASAAGAVDRVNSVTLRYFTPEASQSQAELVRPASPAIGLNVEALEGAPVSGRGVEYVGFKMKPGSPYSIVIEPSKQVLLSSEVSSSGDFSGRLFLPDLPPGTYSVVLQALGEDGKSYQLSQAVGVGSDRRVLSISEPIGKIGSSSILSLPETGGSRPMLLASALMALLVGSLLVFVGHRKRSETQLDIEQLK